MTRANMNRGAWRFATTLAVALALMAGCVPQVQPSDVSANGCEAPTDDNLVTEALMLPGRDCMSCHRPGGMASGDVWTAAGTVYGTALGPCNTGGVEGVEVDITDMSDKVLISLFTNRAGNFFTSEKLDFSTIRVKISKGNQENYMTTFQPNADCPSCHSPTGTALGRIFLP